ncbi:hypothetical protein GW17_00057459 [Ensete ventricosum]|nr:hypothetical protein GW17_00057459 [Ensete ventricosum]
MLSCDSEKKEGVYHEPEPLLVLMGWATAATWKATVQQGSAGVVEEEDGDGSGSDVSKAVMVTSLRQGGSDKAIRKEMWSTTGCRQHGWAARSSGDGGERVAAGDGVGCDGDSDPFTTAHAVAKLTMGAAGDEEKGSGYFAAGRNEMLYFCQETEIRQKRSRWWLLHA